VWLDGPDYHVSKRFWAFAAYSRFIRPDAYRVKVRPDLAEMGLKVSAFRRPDGGAVLNVLNLRADATGVTVDLTPDVGALAVQRWLTDADHALIPMAPQSPADPVLLPARSLTTLVWEPAPRQTRGVDGAPARTG
jgi:glucosylceramidase